MAVTTNMVVYDALTKEITPTLVRFYLLQQIDDDGKEKYAYIPVSDRYVGSEEAVDLLVEGLFKRISKDEQ